MDVNLDELCICTHTFEEHFGHDCSRLFHDGTPCPCKEFVRLDFGVKMFEAPKALVENPFYTDEYQDALKRATALLCEAKDERLTYGTSGD